MVKVLRISVFIILLALIITISFTAGMGAATYFGLTMPGSQTSSEVQTRFKVFWQAWDVVQKEYVDRANLDSETMTRGAIRGMLQSLGDPHTVYIEPKHLQYEREEFGESFGGIGASVTIRNNVLTVVAPIAGSPAEKAGIRAGDRILRVDGEDASKLTLQEAVSKIRGPMGTKVKLQILQEGSRSPIEMEIARGEVKTVSVYTEMLPDSIALLRITHFSQRTDTEVTEALRELRKGEIKGLIIDLRSNPGGYLHVTVNATSQFLSDGIVLYEEDAKGNRETWTVRRGGLATDIPLAVLMNKGSASGSEILAGAVQDHGRGLLIGEESFGKGEAQRQYDLSDGSAVAVTVSRWLTPKGRQIEGKGLSPDIEVKMTIEDFQAKGDIQLQRAVEYITTGK